MNLQKSYIEISSNKIFGKELGEQIVSSTREDIQNLKLQQELFTKGLNRALSDAYKSNGIIIGKLFELEAGQYSPKLKFNHTIDVHSTSLDRLVGEFIKQLKKIETDTFKFITEDCFQLKREGYSGRFTPKELAFTLLDLNSSTSTKYFLDNVEIFMASNIYDSFYSNLEGFNYKDIESGVIFNDIPVYRASTCPSNNIIFQTKPQKGVTFVKEIGISSETKMMVVDIGYKTKIAKTQMLVLKVK